MHDDTIPYEQLTNFQKWRIYTSGLTSPNSFIDFGWYYLISSALQRRVWIPPSHKPVFPNQFMAYVANPGVGKGLVTSTIMTILKYHRLKDPNESATIINGNKTGDIADAIDRTLIESAAAINYTMGGQYERRGSGNKSHDTERPTILPVAPDASSYEALVTSTAKALRLKRYIEFDPKVQRNITKLYTHSSICFCLEELSSMFRKRAEDVVYFLQQAYDCGDYAKDTKSQGCDRIQKCCVNIIGGTTPETMRKIFKDGLLNEGYASRTIHIFEGRDRKTQMFIPDLSELQKRAYDDILAHILILTDLYGQVQLEQQTVDWLEDWWHKQQEARLGISDKLMDYYARKKMHVMKMGMAIHFSESTDMKVPLSAFQRATEMLHSIEDRMHLALVHNAENPLYRAGVKVVKFLTETNKSCTQNELFAKFYEDLPGPDPKQSIEKILEYNMLMGRIIHNRIEGKELYSVIRKEG